MARDGQAGRRGIIGWILFDPAAQPFFTLITTFVFAPYFAAHVAASPVAGQALWGYATAAAAIVIAVLSPVLGAIADACGPRKPWIVAFSVPLVLGSAALWLTPPGGDASVAIALAGFAVATIGAEFATVFNNAMMADLVPEHRVGRLSGVGWAAGYAGGLVSLVIMLGFLVGNPETGRTFFGLAPLFGLDPARFEGDRASGPFTALWYVALVLPLLLFTPDVPRRLGIRQATEKGLANLRETLAAITRDPNPFRFLLANMVYADGLVALFAFGGIYAAGTFGWSAVELGLFGILLTVTGTAGALIGGFLDDRLGPKRVALVALVVLALACLGILSIDRDHIGFVVEAAPPVPGDGLFAAAGERVYLALGALIGAVAGPLQAASRTLLVRVSPRERIAQYFGLFALSGKATSFLGPLLVGLVTSISASQRAGVSVLLAFFVIGALLLSRVRPERSVPAGATALE
jgi:UMF1 family MFS transporter